MDETTIGIHPWIILQWTWMLHHCDSSIHHGILLGHRQGSNIELIDILKDMQAFNQTEHITLNVDYSDLASTSHVGSYSLEEDGLHIHIPIDTLYVTAYITQKESVHSPANPRLFQHAPWQHGNPLEGSSKDPSSALPIWICSLKQTLQLEDTADLIQCSFSFPHLDLDPYAYTYPLRDIVDDLLYQYEGNAWVVKIMHTLTQRYPYSMIRILLLFLQTKPAPLKKICSYHSSHILMEATYGLFEVLKIFLDVPNFNPSIYRIITVLITSIPSSIDKKTYITKICDQLYPILHIEPKREFQERLLHASFSILSRIVVKYPEIAMKRIVKPMMRGWLPYIFHFYHILEVKKKEKALRSPTLEVAENLDKDSKDVTLLKMLRSPFKSRKPLIQEISEVPVKEHPSNQGSSVSLPSSPFLMEYERTLESSKSLWDLVKEDLSIESFDWIQGRCVILEANGVESTILRLRRWIEVDPPQSVYTLLIPWVPVLYEVSALSSKLRKIGFDLLLRILTSLPSPMALFLWTHLLLDMHKDWEGVFSILNVSLSHFEFEPVSQGIQIVAMKQKSLFPMKSVDHSAWIDLLKQVPKEKRAILGDIFLVLLQKLIEMKHQGLNSLESMIVDFDKGLSLDSALEGNLSSSQSPFFLLHVLMLMMEDLGNDIIKNTVQICLFIQHLFTSNLLSDDDESIYTLLFMILDLMIEFDTFLKEEADVLLTDLIPSIQVIKDLTQVEAIQQHALKTLTLIQEYMKNKRSEVCSTPTAIDRILKDIQSPLLPIRAGGLIQLRALLLNKDEESLKRFDGLLDLFVHHLKHSNEESVIYLSAIEGLSIMADIDFDRVYPYLKEELQRVSNNVEYRLTIGESLVKISRRLGELLPKYSDELIPLFLGLVHDEDKMIRASSLSNLSDIFEILSFGIGKHIEQVMEMVFNIMSIEKDFYVRRAALHMVTSVILGLGIQVMDWIPSHIPRLIAFLRFIIEADPDDTLRQFAQISLDVMLDIAKHDTPYLELPKSVDMVHFMNR